MRRLAKILLIILTTLGLLAAALHLTLTYRAKNILRRVTEEMSMGKYTADAERITFYYFPIGIKIKEFSLKPMAQKEKLATLRCGHINIRLESLWDLVFHNELRVRRFYVQQPSLQAYSKPGKGDKQRDIPHTLQTIQENLFRLFSLLQVKRALIEDATLKILPASGDSTAYFGINHLTIDLANINIEKGGRNGKDIFNLEGTISLNKPDIHLADSTLAISLGRLQAQSATRDLVIDSMVFRHNDRQGRPKTVRLAHLKLAKFNWGRFLAENVIELDSVLVASGAAEISLLQQQKESVAQDNTSPKGYNGTSFEIHYASISDISYTLETRNIVNRDRGQQMLMQLKGDSVVLQEFSLISGRQPALAIGSFNIRVRDFKENDESNTYQFSLGDISINNNTLILKDYLLQPTEGSLFRTHNKIRIPELRLEQYELNELLEKRMHAKRVTVIEPEVVLDILDRKKETSAPRKDLNTAIADMMRSLAPKVDIGELVIQHADLHLLPRAKPEDDIQLSGLTIRVDGKKAIHARSFTDIMHAVQELSSSGFTLSAGKMQLRVEDMKLLEQPRGMYVGRLQGSFGPYASIDLRGVTFLNANQTFDITTADGLHLSDISVEGGTVTLQQPPAGSKKEKGEAPPIRADHLSLQNIRFKLEEDGKVGVSSLLAIDARDFLLQQGIASWTTLALGGESPEVIAGKTRFKAGSMKLDYPGTITLFNPVGETRGDFARIQFSADLLRIGIGLGSTQIPSLEIKSLELQQPNVKVEARQKPFGKTANERTMKPLAKPVYLESLKLTNPRLDFTFTDSAGKMLHKTLFEKGEFLATSLRLSNEDLGPQASLGGILINITSPSASIGEKTFRPSHLFLKARDLLYRFQSNYFRLHIDTARLNKISHQWISARSDTMQASAAELGIVDLPFAKGDSIAWKLLLREKTWWVKGAQLSWHNPKQQLHVYNLMADHGSGIKFSLDSLHMRPQPDRHNFWMSQPYEKDYISLKTGRIAGMAPSIDLHNRAPGLYLHKLEISDLFLVPQRDKTRPEDTVSYRPLLASQIAGIPIPVKIDSLVLQNGTVQYHEIGKKTGREGLIFLDNINGTIVNIKNHDFTEKDSLILRMTTRLYGKGPVFLGHRQSYTDTLQGFVMRIRMGQFGMREMNAFLRPQMGLQIKGGTIDTMSLLVKGNKYFAYGTMDMRFHDMSVRLLGEGEKEKYFGANFINWLINQILRRHDNGKADLIFKERVQKRGQFNFWGKIALEGVLTNIGVKSDRRERQKFKKELKEYNLPREYWDD